MDYTYYYNLFSFVLHRNNIHLRVWKTIKGTRIVLVTLTVDQSGSDKRKNKYMNTYVARTFNKQ